MTFATRHPLSGQVIQTVEQIAAAAHEAGDTDSAAVLAQECLLAGMSGSTVVVVGEKKRGKSSLINALVGRRGLLPVNADVATRVHVTVRYAETDRATVYGLADHPDGMSIPLTEIPEYVDEARAIDPATGEERHPVVERVDIGVSSPLLSEGLVLIDTPGVGGLVAGHTAITLATLKGADALLFVVDATSEFHASELAFLTKAAERIPTVLFALTQIDKNSAWLETLKLNQKLLREHAPRFAAAPWFPVSNRFKIDADDAASVNPARSEKLLADSRFVPLLTELRDNIMLRIATDRLTELLNNADRVIDLLDADAERRLRSLDLDPRLVESIRARQAELKELRGSGASWRAELADRFRHVETTLRSDLESGLREIERNAHAAIDAGGRDIRFTVPRDLDDAIRGLALDLQSTLHATAGQVVADLGERFGVHGVYVPPLEILLDRWQQAVPYDDGEMPPDVGQAVAWPAPAEEQRSGEMVPQHVQDKLVGYAKNAGKVYRSGLTKWKNMKGGGKAALILAVIGAIGAVIGGIMAYRGARTKDELRRVVGEVVDRARRTLPGALRESIVELLTHIESQASERISARVDELERAIAEAEHDRETAEAEREAPREEVRAQRARLATLRSEVTDLKRQLASGN
ncbi:MAG: dynamin family protein [Microbispora sp.]|nr:dynamin family protein [Microbispora sp.]